MVRRRAELRVDIETSGLDLHPLDRAVEARGQPTEIVEQVESDSLFIVSDGFDVHQRTRQLKQIHRSAWLVERDEKRNAR